MNPELRKVLDSVPNAGKRHKYGAKKAGSLVFGGRVFDSKAERDRAEQLYRMELDGEISELGLQPVIAVAKYVNYKPDFVYIEASTGVRVWEDVKGVETEGFRIKKNLWRENGPGPLHITKRKGSGGEFLITKTIYPDPD